MGIINHNAIIVVGDVERIDRAYQAARAFELIVTSIVDSKTNGYASFMVAPDGSKEGWDTSDRFNDLRDSFINWLEVEGEGWYNWIEVSFGELECRVTRGRDKE